MLQHRLHDAVGTLPMLDDLFEIAIEQSREVIDLRTNGVSERFAGNHFPQLVNQFGGERGEIVYEIRTS
jgi:hypothetical protein